MPATTRCPAVTVTTIWWAAPTTITATEGSVPTPLPSASSAHRARARTDSKTEPKRAGTAAGVARDAPRVGAASAAATARPAFSASAASADRPGGDRRPPDLVRPGPRFPAIREAGDL